MKDLRFWSQTSRLGFYPLNFETRAGLRQRSKIMITAFFILSRSFSFRRGRESKKLKSNKESKGRLLFSMCHGHAFFACWCLAFLLLLLLRYLLYFLNSFSISVGNFSGVQSLQVFLPVRYGDIGENEGPEFVT